MNIKTQLVIILVLVFFLILLTNLVRKKVLEIQYYLPWFVVVFLLVIVTAFPDKLETVSEFLGITLPINMIFFCGFIFSLGIIFSLTVAISRMSKRLKSLVQYVALLEKRINREE